MSGNGRVRVLLKRTFAQHNYESDRNGLGELRKGIAIVKIIGDTFSQYRLTCVNSLS